MFDDIQTVLQEACGLRKDLPVIAGVSGGPDSLCLLSILRESGFRVIVAHFNHKLRSDADADANAVEQAASRMNFASVIENGDVREYAAEHKLSLEEAARIMRYRFLMEQARHFNAQAVAVGHTADDQVETVLMHFIRGAGLSGLKGMTYRTILPAFDREIPVVRPLLDHWREETVVYCAARGLRPRYDLSNDSLDFFRNRIRNLLIPALESYNPRFKEAVWRTSHSLMGDHEVLLKILDDAWSACVSDQTVNMIAFNKFTLHELSLGLQRQLIRRAIEILRPDGLDVGYSVLERAVRFISNHDQHHTDLVGGLQLMQEDGKLFIFTDTSHLPSGEWPQMPTDSGTISLKVPGSIALTSGWKLNCERWNMASLAMEQAQTNNDPFQVWLDADGIADALELRGRQDGDRFEPLGMDGHVMKISDFFINTKLPQRARERWPLLCMGEKVVWVPGQRPAHSHRLTEATRQALYFSMTKEEE